jgi:hypothetical protein
LDLFKQCPKKYFHLKVAKDIVEPKTEALMYGNRVHKAAEEYIRDGTELPPEFANLKTVLDSLNAFEGTKLCERKMGLTKDLEPCEFFGKNVWWRGMADLLVINGDKATMIDYKTGKTARYAATTQLEILSLAVFKHFPDVKTVRAGLIFLVAGDLIRTAYDATKQDDLWVKWLNDTSRMEAAYDSGVWNASRNFTCSQYCPVLDCHHNGRSK